MKQNHQHSPKASSPPAGGERFTLPPDVTFDKRRLDDGWAYVFRHRTLGELGRVVLQDKQDGRCQVICEWWAIPPTR